MDRSKYISKEESLTILKDLQKQFEDLKRDLSEKLDIHFKSEINNVSVMKEGDDLNGNE